MIKHSKRKITILVILFVILIVVEHYAPRPVNWKDSFSEHDKIPFGCWILRKEVLPALFKNEPVIENNNTLYDHLGGLPSGNKNLIIITSKFSPGDLDFQKLLEFGNQGNQVFVGANQISKNLMDTLGLMTRIGLFDSNSLKSVKTTLNLVNPVLYKPDGYVFSQNLPDNFFTKIDTLNTVILGKDQNNNINFIKRSFGNGSFYIHCQPFVFTNYHLLYSNYEYASAVLSYLPLTYTVWDEYYKPNKKIISSPVRYILSQKSLKAAYFLIILTVLFYFIFEGKRKQRAIPVINAPVNTSLDFIETIGKLYLHRHDHRDLAMKNMMLFNDSIFSRYSIIAKEINKDFYRKLSVKSGVDEALVTKIYTLSNQIISKKKISAEQLTELHRNIQKFKNICL